MGIGLRALHLDAERPDASTGYGEGQGRREPFEVSRKIRRPTAMRQGTEGSGDGPVGQRIGPQVAFEGDVALAPPGDAEQEFGAVRGIVFAEDGVQRPPDDRPEERMHHFEEAAEARMLTKGAERDHPGIITPLRMRSDSKPVKKVQLGVIPVSPQAKTGTQTALFCRDLLAPYKRCALSAMTPD